MSDGKKESPFEKGMANMPNLESLTRYNPTNIVSGVGSGAGNIVGGLLLGVGAAVALPVYGTVYGWSEGGIAPAITGLISGAIIGALISVGAAVGGALGGVYQILIGLIRTPQSIYASIVGNDWDENFEDFVSYNLKTDAEATLNLSDKDFLTELKKGVKPAELLKGKTSSSAAAAADADEEAGAASTLRPKKNLTDREYYDVLGIEPEATPGEIKKAYYVKAKQHHPDRAINDPEAHARFQKIGEAYTILSDPQLRTAYDNRGKDAVANAPKVDASVLYAMIFGSERFEEIIGELSTATQVKCMMDPDSNTSTAFLLFKQRKREVELALLLAAKLQLFVDGEIGEFLEKAKAEAKELSESPLGGTMLATIGQVYCDKSLAEYNSLIGAAMAIKQCGISIVDCVSLIGSVSSLTYNGIVLQNMQKDLDKKQGLSEAERQARAAQNPFSIGPGATATEKEKEVFRQSVKTVSQNFFVMMWQLTKVDIAGTLNGVCNKVLHDRSVSSEVLEKRRLGLGILGAEYCARGVTVIEGIDDLLTRLGPQIFGPESTAGAGSGDDGKEGGHTEASEEAAAAADGGGSSGSSGSSGAKDSGASSGSATWTSDPQVLKKTFKFLGTLTVSELKERIGMLGGNPKVFFEKSELQKELRKLLLTRLSTGDLRDILKDKLDLSFGTDSAMDIPLDPTTCDRDMLLDLLLQMPIIL